jgi:FkbM family methyltransferase
VNINTVKKRWRKIKKFLKRFPFPFTKNQRYDLQAKKIIRKICNKESNCIDVGTHEGEMLDVFLKQSPKGFHLGFEPIPGLYKYLIKKYSSFQNVRIYDLALSNAEGSSEFNYVISNPAYSGIKKRVYDNKNETDTQIIVKKQLLDNIIPVDVRITMMKIDVEGGELDVLEGSIKTLAKYKPAILFEFGIGGSDIYGANPEKLFIFFTQFNYNIFLLKDFLKRQKPLSLHELKNQFYNRINYYFIAY